MCFEVFLPLVMTVTKFSEYDDVSICNLLLISEKIASSFFRVTAYSTALENEAGNGFETVTLPVNTASYTGRL